MLPSLLGRLVSRLYTNGKRMHSCSLLMGMFKADVASASVRGCSAFRPRLEVLEDRLAPAVSFAAQATFATGNDPLGVAVADFNGDGKPDLVIPNYNSGTVSVLLNTAPKGATAPSFAAQLTFSVGASPNYVAVGDINGDGRPDIAVVNYNSSTVAVLLNTTAPGATAPTFAALQTFTVGAEPSQLAFADFNGDGRPDLVVTDKNVSEVSVLINTTAAGATAASFTGQQTFATGNVPYGVAVGDLNGDGRPDIVVSNYNSSSVSVLLDTMAFGATVATFAAQQAFAVGTSPVGVALVDLNGDGRPDVAVANNNSSNVSILMNTTMAGATAAAFAAQQTFATSANPWGLAVGDFSGDGRPDLAVGSSGTPFAVLENTTTVGATAASFVAQQTFASTSNALYLAAGDFNFDGQVDLAVVNTTGPSVSVYLNNLPTFQAAVTGPVVVGDFKGYGVQQYNSTANTYVQLSKFDPTVLTDNADGWVAGNFPGYGVQLYRPGFNAFGSFAQITPVTATLLSMDAQGDIVGNFPGYGTQLYRGSTGWVQITPFQSTGVALDAYGNVIAIFAGYGIQQFSLASNSWKVITPFNPTTFAVNAYDQIVAVFAGYGVQKFTPWSGWLPLTGGAAQFTAMSVAINSYGVVLANFPGYGVQENFPGVVNWVQTTPVSGQFLALDRYGHGYGDFPGYGVNVFTPGASWVKITPTDPALLAVADWPFDLASPY